MKQYKLKDLSGKIYYEYELLDEKEEPNHLSKNQNQWVENQGVETPPLENWGYIITMILITQKTITLTGKITHTPPKIVCENTIPNVNISENHIVEPTDPMLSKIIFRNLQQRIQNITGYNISDKKLKELIAKESVDNIQYHLNNWHVHKQYQKTEGAGWFITIVENNIKPEEYRKTKYNQNKIPHCDNFDQREYTDEELEKYYANLNE